MSGDEVDVILNNIYRKSAGNTRWKAASSIQNLNIQNSYDDLHSSFQKFPSSPFTAATGDYINIMKMINCLLFIQNQKEIAISLCSISPADKYIGFKISFGSEKHQIQIDQVQLLLSSLTEENVEISDVDSQRQEGMIKVENEDEIFIYSFDFDTFTINGYSSAVNENFVEKSVSFVAKSQIFDQFYVIIWKTLISMMYLPDTSLILSLGKNALLCNIPKSNNRFEDFAKLLFPGLATQMYSHSESSSEIQATSTATIVYMVKAPKMSSDSKSSSENIQREKKSATSLFLLFTFLNGIPQESNCTLAHDVLSSISWSDLSISFIPLPNNHNNIIIEDEKFDQDFLKSLKHSLSLPFATCSSVVNRPGTIIIAFLNTTKESAKAISRVALTEAFRKMKGVIRDKKKSFARLNKIWESIDSISNGISNILSEDQVYENVWDACCQIQNAAYLKKSKLEFQIEDSQLI